MSIARQDPGPRWPALAFGRRPRLTAPMTQPLARGRAAVEAPYAAIAIYGTVESAAEAWTQLERVAPCSPYQQRTWIAGWAATAGVAEGITPMIVVAEDDAGRPLALLPLGLRRRGFVSQALFLGGRQTNYNMGLFDPGLTWTEPDVAQLLADAARTAPGRVDLYLLVNQPVSWEGFANPLASLRSQPSPSFSHRAVLQGDADAFLRAHLSGPARKKLRSKAAALALLGPVSHRVARGPEEVAAVLTAHIAQKADKLALLGIAPPDERALRGLLDRTCLPSEGEPPPVELHALWCGDTIVATFGGLAHARRFSGLLISYASEPTIARTSPGELLLSAVVREKCAAGFEGFDLGIGEARYKEHYCPVADPLVDTVLPLTAAGHTAAAAVAGSLRVKSAIKRSPPLWAAARAVRRLSAPLRRKPPA